MAVRLFRGLMSKGLDGLKELYYTGAVKPGACVGKDALGNKYYEDLDDLYGKHRYVIYANPKAREATEVTAEWHAWIHHVVDTPPSMQTIQKEAFEVPHRANVTGSASAYAARDTVTKAKMQYWRPKAASPVAPKEYPEGF
eukprot:a176045_265.p2 GENE.a176045_265~~a176045_265.p2  ORF type:complete len:152 (-),score=66.76 a176045_265:28-450(-)